MNWKCIGNYESQASELELSMINDHRKHPLCRGFQVAPADLEGCLFDHTDVADACVVGIPDEYSGEVPLAFVVLKEDARRIIEQDPRQAANIKASIVKVDMNSYLKFSFNGQLNRTKSLYRTGE